MVAEPGALLHLRPAVRDVRRRSCLHLPVGGAARDPRGLRPARDGGVHRHSRPGPCLCMAEAGVAVGLRSEEHTSELQSLAYLVCRLLLEKKKIIINYIF